MTGAWKHETSDDVAQGSEAERNERGMRGARAVYFYGGMPRCFECSAELLIGAIAVEWSLGCKPASRFSFLNEAIPITPLILGPE